MACGFFFFLIFFLDNQMDPGLFDSIVLFLLDLIISIYHCILAGLLVMGIQMFYDIVLVYLCVARKMTFISLRVNVSLFTTTLY